MFFSACIRTEKNIAVYNQHLRRNALIGAEITQRPSGSYTVTLSLSDEQESVMKLELLVTKEAMAKELQKRFRKDAETLYSKIISALYEFD